MLVGLLSSVWLFGFLRNYWLSYWLVDIGSVWKVASFEKLGSSFVVWGQVPFGGNYWDVDRVGFSSYGGYPSSNRLVVLPSCKLGLLGNVLMLGMLLLGIGLKLVGLWP